MTNRKELEAALADAEAALASAVINATKVDGNRTEADANLGKARVHCRHLRAALAELDRSEFMALSREWIYTPIDQSGEVSKPGVSASPHSGQTSARAIGDENTRSQDESRQRKSFQQFKTGFPAEEPRTRGARARPTLLRQTIGLLALTLAYLQYYYIDVQLQILSLPSVIAFPLE